MKDVETVQEIDLCSSFITASAKYVGRFYLTIPTDCVIGSMQYVLGHTIANVNELCDVEGEWHVVGFQGRSRKKSNIQEMNNSSKLGVTNNAKSKPKKKRKNKKKKKESTVKPENTTTVEKKQGTFEKVINFIKSLGSETSNRVSRAGFPANTLYLDSGASISILFNDKLLNNIDTLPQAANVKAGGSDIKLTRGGALHRNLSSLSLIHI